VGQRCHGPGFALEPREVVGIAHELLGQNLEGDVATEAGVASAVDFAHPAGAYWGDDLVMAELRTVGERQFSLPPSAPHILRAKFLFERVAAGCFADLLPLDVP
jgi:hypothetical protein